MDKQILGRTQTDGEQHQWEAFSNYVDALVEQQHKILEQADTDTIMFRSQGAVASLKKLKLLRDEVLKKCSMRI